MPIIPYIKDSILLYRRFMFSGKDDNYNTIEGLSHKGIAQHTRHSMTEFGSGWDPLRRLVKESLGHTEGTFEKFIASNPFQEALGKASIVKKLGEGAFGETHLMRTSINIGGKDHSFEFARKGFLGGATNGLSTEMEMTRKFSHMSAPNVYGQLSSSAFAMEYIPGTSAQSLMLSGGKLPQGAITDIGLHLAEMHRQGFAHTDIVRDVNRIAGKRGSNPFGEMLPHNILITPEGRAAIIDYGTVANAGVPDARSKTFMHGFAKRQFSTNAEFDMSLVESLRANNGKLSKKAQDYLVKAHMEDLVGHAATPITSVSNKIKKLSMSKAQKMTTAALFENARSAGKRSKSSFVASRYVMSYGK